MKIGGPDFPAKAVPLPHLPAGLSPREALLQAAKHPVEHPAALPVVLKDLALSLGLPQDKLSFSLLSFIRFFSLPLDPKLIRHLRQEVLSLKIPPKDPKAGPEKAKLPFMDSMSGDRIRPAVLAAAAAAGKGLTLSTGALEKYAAAIAGEEGNDDDAGGGGDGGGAGRHGAEYAGEKGHSEDGPDPERLRDMVEKIEGQSPLLGILNKIPGKDGRRWINLPFSFSSGGVDYSVSLRLLLADTNAIPWKAECLALDIAQGGREYRRWSFTLENAGKGGGTLIVRIYPPPAKPAVLEGALRGLLGTVAEEVILKDMAEGAFFEGGYQ
jgi:hypothetical protein